MFHGWNKMMLALEHLQEIEKQVISITKALCRGRFKSLKIGGEREGQPGFLLDTAMWPRQVKKCKMITHRGERRFTLVGEGGSGRRPLPPQTLIILVGFTLKQLLLYCIFGLDLK